jgi:hypothetical protein
VLAALTYFQALGTAVEGTYTASEAAIVEVTRPEPAEIAQFGDSKLTIGRGTKPGRFLTSFFASLLTLLFATLSGTREQGTILGAIEDLLDACRRG